MLSSSIASPIPPFGSDVTLICTVLLTSGLEIYVSLNVNFELLRTDPSRSPLTTTPPSVSGSTHTTAATISSFGRNDSGVYTCRATVSSASTNTYIRDSNTESHSIRVTTGEIFTVYIPDVMIITTACINSSGVYLSLRGIIIANNSNIHIRNIGQSPTVLYSASLTRFLAVSVQVIDLESGTYHTELHWCKGLPQPLHFTEAEEIMERCP